jgi:hypothetical protein
VDATIIHQTKRIFLICYGIGTTTTTCSRTEEEGLSTVCRPCPPPSAASPAPSSSDTASPVSPSSVSPRRDTARNEPPCLGCPPSRRCHPPPHFASGEREREKARKKLSEGTTRKKPREKEMEEIWEEEKRKGKRRKKKGKIKRGNYKT